MVSLGDRLKRFLGGAPEKSVSKPVTKSAAKRGGANPPRKQAAAPRAEIIAEALTVYRRQRGLARDMLDRALKDMRGKPPSALEDPEGLARALALHRAHVDLSKLIGHDLKRYLVLTGLRQWLGEGLGGAAAPQPTKTPQNTVSRR